MSLDGLRDAYIREKKIEIAECERARKRKLRELYHVSHLLEWAAAPQVADWAVSEAPDESELSFLGENDITKGRRFNDSTLPFPVFDIPLPPTSSFQAPAKSTAPALLKSSPSVPPSLEEQLRAASASPSVAVRPVPSVETRPQNGALPVAEPSAPEPRIDSSAPDRSHVGAPAVEEEVARGSLEEELQTTPAPLSIALDPQVEGVQREVSLDGPSVEPQKAVPPTPEDVAMLPEGLSPVVSSEQAPKPPQVVHLPSQEAQEARLQETERELEKVNEKERKEDERLALPSASAPGDLVSSPSSTVGPYSQATPHAPHHSPDTSPDTESFRDRIPPVENGLDSDPAAQQAKEEHERALQRQMQEARERAREGSSPTPEIERQLEDEQAIRLARDGKSRLSESRNTPVAHSVAHSVADATEKIMPEVRLQMPNTEEDRISQGPAADSLPTPTTTAPEPAVPDADTPESQAAKPQEARPIETDHPTPPADIDVEMNDAPPLVQEQSKPLSQPLRSERMITRVSSGAIRQRSVSEIIAEKAAPKTVLTPRSSDLSSASTTPPRRRAQEQKAKEVSTIIFAKQDTSRNSKSLQLYSEEYASLQGVSQDSDRDYLEGLFQYQAHHPPRALPLTELLNSAKKTFSTSGMLAMVRETQNYKILKRVYQLQNANRWSLRQLQKSAEPPRPTSHLDHLLKEMKWMQTDFKEERKWKRALAATFAGWCAEYVNSSPEEQAMARVKARIPQRGRRRSIADEEMHDVPGLSHSGANETESESLVDDEEFLSPYSSNPPAGLFSLGFDDVVMKIDPTPASDAMLQELPTYEPVLEGASDVTPMSFCDPPILPVSKYVTGKLVSEIRGPPRKPSRFEYESEDEPSSPPSRPGTSTEHSMPSTPGRRLFHRHDLAPEMNDVALFNPENKHVRDRLQVAHQFRPPTEFPMPSVSFFENRTSSQWLWEEDQKLRGLVKDFTFNWSLVAQELSLPSMFISGSGRRTPWECFERWVQLEGLPSEMSKTQYFRTYQTRLEQAQRTVTAQHQAQQQLLQQQQQAGQNVSASQLRRRTTQPIRVERRRDNRHLAIIDGMRKLARKRESAAHKQAEAQKAAALRKAHEPAPPKSNVHTPQEFSRLKWEREEKMKQKLQMQQELNMRQQAMAAAAQRQATMQGQLGMPNGVNQPQRNGTPNGVNVSIPMANTSSQPGHPTSNPAMAARQHLGQQGMPANFPNGNLAGMPMNNTGVPQAQMQASMQNAQRMLPPDQVRMAMQRGAFNNPTNQQQFQLQQQQINMASNMAANMNIGNGMPNANMIASMVGQNMNSNMGSPMNGMSNNAGSPRMNQVKPQMQSPARPLSSGHMPQLHQIQNSLKASHPEWSSEQVLKSASDQLSRFMNKQRQQAMSAAAGTPSGMSPSPQLGNNMYHQNGGMQGSSPPTAVQSYQNQLVQQQQRIMSRQQQAGSPGLNQARPDSRSATPQNSQLGIPSPGAQQQPRT